VDRGVPWMQQAKRDLSPSGIFLPAEADGTALQPSLACARRPW
jgi:hypothetical protein